MEFASPFRLVCKKGKFDFIRAVFYTERKRGGGAVDLTKLRYFIMAAQTLNFTKAAQMLYITQPALSKQITALEKELNMQLFLRDQKSVRLTPVGVLLLKELPGLLEHYEKILTRARAVNAGHSGALTIGMLEGQGAGPRFRRAFQRFSSRYPNISTQVVQDSFGGLRRRLDRGEADLAITLDFDIRDDKTLLWEVCGAQQVYFAVSRALPIANRGPLTLADLREETFLLIDPRESRSAAQMVLELCRRAGFRPRVRYVGTTATVMLMVEAGQGLGIIGNYSTLYGNPDIRVLEEMPIDRSEICCAWKQTNLNPAIPLFLEGLKDP